MWNMTEGKIFDVSRMGAFEALMSIYSLAVKKGMEEARFGNLNWNDPDDETIIVKILQEGEKWLNDNVADRKHYFGFKDYKGEEWGYYSKKGVSDGSH
jgi:hypothetical protein